MLLYSYCLSQEQAARALLLLRLLVKQIFPVPAQQCVCDLTTIFWQVLLLVQVLGDLLVLGRCGLTHTDLGLIRLAL